MVSLYLCPFSVAELYPANSGNQLDTAEHRSLLAPKSLCLVADFDCGARPIGTGQG